MSIKEANEQERHHDRGGRAPGDDSMEQIDGEEEKFERESLNHPTSNLEESHEYL